jgi:hypothetical protein
MISWVSSVWAWFTPLISSVVSSKLHGAERERVGRIASTYMYKIPTDATHSLGIGGCGAMGTIPDTRGRNTNTHTTQTHEHTNNTNNTKRRGENKKTKRLYKGGDWSSLLPRHTRNILPPPCLGSLRQILASASFATSVYCTPATTSPHPTTTPHNATSKLPAWWCMGVSRHRTTGCCCSV